MLRVNYENHTDLVSYGVKTVADSPALKDCLVVCSNGEKEVNCLVLGLLFPVLGKCDVFHFPVTQTVLLQGVKLGELENMFSKFESSLSKVKNEPEDDEYMEEVETQESTPITNPNDQINQDLAHIFGAEILDTLDLKHHQDPEENLGLLIKLCPAKNCNKKFKSDKFLEMHIKNAHLSPIKYIQTTPTKTDRYGTPSPSASPTSSPLKFLTPVKQVIPVQTLFKCGFQGCGKTFQKNQTFLKHKSSHKTNNKNSPSPAFLEHHLASSANKEQEKVSTPVSEVKINLDQFYQENDILGEQFAYKNDKREFKCLFDKCRTEFTYRHELRSHYIDHDVEVFMCPECDKKFDIKTSLNEHRFKAHHILTVNKDICLFCDAIFFTKESFRNHVLSKHRGPWQCDSCEEKLFSVNELKQHILDHTDTNLTCDWPNCNIIFPTRNELKTHLSTHKTEEFYTCPKYLCNFFFCTVQGFDNHLESHKHEESYDCNKCNKKYYNMRQFECHIEAGHMQDPKPYEFASEVNMDCPVDNCNRSFVQEKWLLKHLKTHNNTNKEISSNQRFRRSRNTAVKVIKTKIDIKSVKVLEFEQNYESIDANSVFF